MSQETTKARYYDFLKSYIVVNINAITGKSAGRSSSNIRIGTENE